MSPAETPRVYSLHSTFENAFSFVPTFVPIFLSLDGCFCP